MNFAFLLSFVALLLASVRIGDVNHFRRRPQATADPAELEADLVSFFVLFLFERSGLAWQEFAEGEVGLAEPVDLQGLEVIAKELEDAGAPFVALLFELAHVIRQQRISLGLVFLRAVALVGPSRRAAAMVAGTLLERRNAQAVFVGERRASRRRSRRAADRPQTGSARRADERRLGRTALIGRVSPSRPLTLAEPFVPFASSWLGHYRGILARRRDA